MIPIDSKTGKPWAKNVAQRWGRVMRSDIITELLERDKARGADGVTYQKVDGKYVIDQRKAMLRHTADEVDALFRERWYEFCATPQDQEAVLAKLSTVNERDRLTRARETAQKYREKAAQPLAEPGPLPADDGGPETVTDSDALTEVVSDEEAVIADG